MKEHKHSLCRKFAHILGEEILQSKDNICVVTFNKYLDVEILAIKPQSPLVLFALGKTNAVFTGFCFLKNYFDMTP